MNLINDQLGKQKLVSANDVWESRASLELSSLSLPGFEGFHSRGFGSIIWLIVRYGKNVDNSQLSGDPNI